MKLFVLIHETISPPKAIDFLLPSFKYLINKEGNIRPPHVDCFRDIG